MTEKYAGADWLISLGVEMSDLGVVVADVLGQVWRGIYHISGAVRSKKVDWSNPYYISVVIYGGLCSYDNQYLTELLILCYDNMLRLEVTPRAPKYLELAFYPRETRDPKACISKRLPTLEEMISTTRENIGLDEVEK